VSGLAIPPDALRRAREVLGLEPDAVIDPEQGPWVEPGQLLELARALKEELDFRFFVYCAAAHYPSRGPREGAEGEFFLVAYRLRRFGPRGGSFPLRIELPAGACTPSLALLFAGADWQEREQYDLVGVSFEGHPDLRRIMMPEDWPGHPLRRDYAIDTQHFPWR